MLPHPKAALRAIYAFVHPSKPSGFNGVFYALMCAVLLLGFGQHELGVDSRVGGFISPQYTATPDERLFHLTGTGWIVHSAFQWDSGALGSEAVDDIDYGLPYGAHEAARLPGPSWITYRYLAWGYIPGSGTYLTFEAPNGGHIAYFHLTRTWFTAVMHGGQQVGWTGWPTDPVYAGGGPAGAADAHLCVAVDALSQQFLMSGIYRIPKPLPAFHRAIWDSYRVAHHKPLISPWSHHRLTWAASIWRLHQRRLGGVLHRETWNSREHFMKTSFSAGGIYTWPRTKGTKIVYWRHRDLVVLRPADATTQCQVYSTGCARSLANTINADRAQLGLYPLTLDWTLAHGTSTCHGASAHARAMAGDGAIWHVSAQHRQESFPTDVCEPFRTAGQNVGMGYGGRYQAMLSVHQQMMNEGSGGGHYENLMSSSYTRVGIGFAEAGGATYLVETFVG